MKYPILPPAQDDLRHIDNWIVTNFGEAAADGRSTISMKHLPG